VGVSALRYPSGQANPPDSVQMHIGGQMSTSLATGIVIAEVHAEFEQSSQPPPTSTSRQPSATAAAARLPPEGPSLLPKQRNRQGGARTVDLPARSVDLARPGVTPPLTRSQAIAEGPSDASC